MGLLQWLWIGIKRLVGLLLPAFARARDFRGWRPWLRWALHVALLAGVLAGLGFLNYVFDLERVLRAPLPVLRRVWLPLLFVLVYINLWLGGWLWQLLATAKGAAEFADIDAAWAEAKDALERAELDLDKLPVFLILGRPAGSAEALFGGLRCELAVEQAPRARAPIHVSANRDGIYVTCAGASLLAAHAALLASEGSPPEDEEIAAELPAAPDPVRGLRTLVGQAREKGQALRTGSPRDTTGTQLLLADEGAEVASPPRRRRRGLAGQTQEIERQTARLKHLCRLLRRDRQPYCPLNGILVLVPFAATGSLDDAEQAGSLCRRELAAVRDVLQVHCPVYALVCDLEQLAGFREFVERLPEERRHRRLGIRFPYAPAGADAKVAERIEDGVRWVCQSLLPPLVFRLLRLSGSGRAAPAELEGNVLLYHFLQEMRDRWQALSHLLVRGMAPAADEPALLGGCYLAGTGPERRGERAFLGNVVQQLVDSQNGVAWTGAALNEEREYRRLVKCGYLGMGLFIAAVLLVAYLL
jgi:hypothetical protein